MIPKSRLLTTRPIVLNPDCTLESTGKLLKSTDTQTLPPEQLTRISCAWDTNMWFISKLSWVIIICSLDCKPLHHAQSLCSCFSPAPLHTPSYFLHQGYWKSNIYVKVFKKHCYSRIWSQVQSKRYPFISTYRLCVNTKTLIYHSHLQRGPIKLAVKALHTKANK